MEINVILLDRLFVRNDTKQTIPLPSEIFGINPFNKTTQADENSFKIYPRMMTRSKLV